MGTAKKKIVIAGANGFIGRHLTQMLGLDYHIIALVRHDTRIDGAAEYAKWDGKSLGDWKNALEDSFAVINLSGKSVNTRFTEKNKKAILDSRVDTTTVIGAAIAECAVPPLVWINASGASIYPETGRNPVNEKTKEQDDDFLAKVTLQWEDAMFSAPCDVRKVALRTTLVMGRDGGTFPVLRKITKFFLGGRQGSGKQMVSWIHIDDYCRIVDQVLLNDSSVEGPVNMVAPEVVTNEIMMKEMRRGLGVPFGLPSPGFILKIGGFILGTEPSLVLKSSCVSSLVLKEKQFQFRYPTISEAIENLAASKKT